MTKSNSVLFSKVVGAMRVQAAVTQIVANGVDRACGVVEKLLRGNRDMLLGEVQGFLLESKAIVVAAGGPSTEAEGSRVEDLMKTVTDAFDGALRDVKDVDAMAQKVAQAEKAAKAEAKKVRKNRKLRAEIVASGPPPCVSQARLYDTPIELGLDTHDNLVEMEPGMKLVGHLAYEEIGVVYRPTTALIILNGRQTTVATGVRLQHGDTLTYGKTIARVEIPR
jgi:hypothetical protein